MKVTRIHKLGLLFVLALIVNWGGSWVIVRNSKEVAMVGLHSTQYSTLL